MNDTFNATGDAASKTLAERVHAQQRPDIIEGKHPPGSELHIDHLKQLYGIGGGRCREALTLLQSDSLVTLSGQGGLGVADVSYADFADITNTRLLVEVEALRQGITHGDENRETDVVAAFHRLSRADEALSAADPEAISNRESRNQAFHEALISACPSRWLKHFVAILYNQAERYRRLMLAYIDTEGSPVKAEWPRQKKEHADIFDASLKRDVARAAERLTAHIGGPWPDIKTLQIFSRSAGKTGSGRRAKSQPSSTSARRFSRRQTMRNFAGLAVATLAACLATTAPASAQTAGGFYAGGGIGWANVSVEDDDFDDCCYYYPYPYDYDYDYDSGEEDVAFDAHIGYRFNPYFAAELGYLDAGKPHWDHRDVYVRGLDDYADTEVDLEIQAAQLSVLAILPFGGIWEGYARIGASFWRADAEQSVYPLFDDVYYTRSIDDEGTSFLFGIGIGASPAPGWHVRFEFQSFPIEEELLVSSGDTTVDTFLLEVQFRPAR